MIKTAALFALSLGLTVTIPLPATAAPPLKPVPPDQVPERLGFDQQLWETSGKPGEQISGQAATSHRTAFLAAIDHSLRYLQTPTAREHYRKLTTPGITRDRVQRSLVRFRQLLQQVKSPAELQAAVQQEFIFYQSVGRDDQGTVGFTGYFEPTYTASRTPTPDYRYPLYRLPPRFDQWSHPHPTRAQLEGIDGLQGASGPLRGLELVWLRDRLEAFLIQVQGSAQLQLTAGGTMTVGFAVKTDQTYTGVGKELVKDGKVRLEDLTLLTVIQYFQRYPTDLNRYLPRNRSFVFFRETYGAAATGSLGVPVTAERSIATDKALMPPGALALLQTQIPHPTVSGQLEQRLVSRYTLDQDTGSAIRGPGRVDIFMGTGAQAGERAGRLVSTGQLYYLLLK